MRSDFVSVPRIAAPLLSVQFVPPFVLYFGFGTSLAEGTAVAIFITLSIFVAGEAVALRRLGRPLSFFDFRPFLVAAVCVLLVVPHAAVADYFQTIALARLLKTIPFLFLLIAAAIALGDLLLKASEREVKATLSLSFGVLCVALSLRLTGMEPRSDFYGKPIFPFSETSHFVLAFVPVLLYRCATSSRRAALGWLSFSFAIALGLESMTLLIASLLIAIVCRRTLLVTLGGLVIGLGVIPFQLDYFLSRLDPSNSSDNISSLVYVQGWQLLIEAMSQTFGWGVGFQQLGQHGTSAAAADTLLNLLTGSGLDALNLTDGSFVFAKLTGEMGVFGFLLSVVLVIAAVHSIRVLRWVGRRIPERSIIVFARCVLISFMVDMFIRGTGYFAGSTFLAITACSILLANCGATAFFSKARAVRRSAKTLAGAPTYS